MKKLQAPIAGLFILSTVLGCKKDLQQEMQPEPSQNNQPVAAAAVNPGGIAQSGWQGSLAWSSVELPSHSVFYTNIKTDISAETAEQGLVRVFKATASGTPQSLPFEETVNGHKYYWYYQVTEGNLMISVDVYGSQQNPAEGSLFQSVVLSKTALAGFEAKGSSRSKLMNMPFEAITSNP